MSIDAHHGLDVAGMVAAAKEREDWKVNDRYAKTYPNGNDGYAVHDGWRIVAPSPIREADARFIALAPATILALAARAEAAERERDEAREVMRWRTVVEKPSEDIERCLLLKRHYGQEFHCFGEYTTTGGWFYLAQYGDGSEYAEPLDDGEWYWLPLPQPPQGGA